MTDISVIILTKNELLHIKRCLERLLPLEPRQIFIVDCFSTDDTKGIVRSFSNSNSDLQLSFVNSFLELQLETPTKSFTLATNDQRLTTIHFVEHPWPGNQALQFNWAVDNLPIKYGWILRLDADEYLTDELIAEIKTKLPQIEEGVDGVVLKRRHCVGWLGGKWIKRGMYPTRILRLFRTGRARYAEDMAMDEHLVVQGSMIEFDYDFVDESLISFEDWKAKHRGYAKREAQMAVSGKVNPNKRTYYRLPPYFRAFAYFCIRYFLKLGFLDGLPGFRWHFWQGLWYRWLVDKEISRMKA